MGRKTAASAAAAQAREAAAEAAEAGEAAAAAEAGSRKTAKRRAAAISGEEEATPASTSSSAARRVKKKTKQQHQQQPQQQQQQQQQRKHNKRQDAFEDEQEESVQSDATPTSTCPEAPATDTAAAAAAAETSAAAAAAETAAAAAVAADPYLLEDAEYLRREKRWLNRQRVLVLGSRGVSAKTRHLLEDLKRLLPHHKAETKWEKKEKLQSIAELCQLRSCNSVLYLEQRKHDALLHVVKVPLGPTFIARIMNVETLSELRLSGNCLLHSRPLLLFAPEFDTDTHLKLLKELFMQVFGTPRNHPKSKPFFDHVMSFFVADNRIWFRHYQVAPLVVGEGGDANVPHRQTYIEIGPRFVMDPVKILEGSFCGKTLWKNEEFVRTRDLMRPRRLQAAMDFARRLNQKTKRKIHLESILEKEPRNKLAFENIFGVENIENKQKPKP